MARNPIKILKTGEDIKDLGQEGENKVVDFEE
jgi:hypothetical protein